MRKVAAANMRLTWMSLLAKSIEATRHAGLIYAQHRIGVVDRRAGGP